MITWRTGTVVSLGASWAGAQEMTVETPDGTVRALAYPAVVGDVAAAFGPGVRAPDGGIDRATIAACAEAGADQFVAGTSLYSKSDMAAEIRLFRQLASDAVQASTSLPPTRGQDPGSRSCFVAS